MKPSVSICRKITVLAGAGAILAAIAAAHPLLAQPNKLTTGPAVGGARGCVNCGAGRVTNLSRGTGLHCRSVPLRPQRPGDPSRTLVCN
jgi:hypothetical protein